VARTFALFPALLQGRRHPAPIPPADGWDATSTPMSMVPGIPDSSANLPAGPIGAPRGRVRSSKL